MITDQKFRSRHPHKNSENLNDEESKNYFYVYYIDQSLITVGMYEQYV
jgi:hypothetical protein